MENVKKNRDVDKYPGITQFDGVDITHSKWRLVEVENPEELEENQCASFTKDGNEYLVFCENGKLKYYEKQIPFQTQ